MGRGYRLAGVALATGALSIFGTPWLTGHAATGKGVSSARVTANATSTSYAGYVAAPSGVSSASTKVVVPAITCPDSKNDYGIAPGAFLAGTSDFTGADVEEVCTTGSITYTVALVINSAETKSFAATPGNTYSISVSETASASSVSVKDLTTKKSVSSKGAGGSVTEAFIIDDAIDFGTTEVGVPTFTNHSFSAATIDHAAVSNAAPTAYNRVNSSNVVQIVTGPLNKAGNGWKETFAHN
jgi:hypothetical protein